MKLPKIQRVTQSVALALSHVHRAEFMHCDVKPENILLSGPATKLIDFGACRPIRDTAYVYLQSRFYRAPEMLDEDQYDERIDVWSLGCLAAEMWLRSPLFFGKNSEEVAEQII